jgi:hypothetical protein
MILFSLYVSGWLAAAHPRHGADAASGGIAKDSQTASTVPKNAKSGKVDSALGR